MKTVLYICKIVLIIISVHSCKYIYYGDFNSTFYGATVKGRIIDNHLGSLSGAQILMSTKARDRGCLKLNKASNKTVTNENGDFELIVGSNALVDCSHYKISDHLGKSFKDTILVEINKNGYKTIKKEYIVRFRFADFTLQKHKKSDFENVKWEGNDLGTIMMEDLESIKR